eukprot:SM000128S26212  [mRNA]  locus=s128:73008:80210:+ [translate_table: standard]
MAASLLDSLITAKRDGGDGGAGGRLASCSSYYLLNRSGRFSCVTIPPALSSSICFVDHDHDDSRTPPTAVHDRSDDNGIDACCLKDTDHVHAHVHDGEITQEVTLDQCQKELCNLPATAASQELVNCTDELSKEEEHLHTEGCGHEPIFHGDHTDFLLPMEDGSFVLRHPHAGSPHIHQSLIDEVQQEAAVEVVVTSPTHQLQSTTLNVFGICCPSESGLVTNLLKAQPGVTEVTVNAVLKTTIVIYDSKLISDVQLVRILNEAKLDASIHRRGTSKPRSRWPSCWTILCGLLLGVALFKYLYPPLKWVALASIAIKLPSTLLKSIRSLSRYICDINTLMTIAVVGAVALGDYVEGATVVFLFALSEYLETRSTEKARHAIEDIINLAPETALLAESGMRVPVESLEVGSVLLVKPGEKIPVDSKVVSGTSTVDESNLTGESRPVTKDSGSMVWAGTMNTTGPLRVVTMALAKDSAVAKLVRLVEDAQKQRSKTEQFVEACARYYTPAVLLSATLVTVIPLAIGVPNIRHWLYLALVLLVVACPCALVISTPITTIAGLAQGARCGILIKGGRHLETLGRLKVLAFDKTGTLTRGLFRVAHFQVLTEKVELSQILSWLASVEAQASHPVAPALVLYANVHGVKAGAFVENFETLAGEGVAAEVEGRVIRVGNKRMASRLGWLTELDSQVLERWSEEGGTVGYIGADGQPLAIFSVNDEARPEAKTALQKLRAGPCAMASGQSYLACVMSNFLKISLYCMKGRGIHVAMLTGDNPGAAQAIQLQVGNIDVYSELLPEDKVQVLCTLKRGGMTGMVGDGINDAPALAAADLGIAMGAAGSALAVEVADVALMQDDLHGIEKALVLGRSCRNKIIQNVVLSIVTKGVVVGLAIGGWASLWAALLADVGTTLVVITNSLRILARVERRSTGHGTCKSIHEHKGHHGDSSPALELTEDPHRVFQDQRSCMPAAAYVSERDASILIAMAHSLSFCDRDSGWMNTYLQLPSYCHQPEDEDDYTTFRYFDRCNMV